MQVRTVEVRTSLGVVPVTGNFDSPIKVLAITGMHAAADEMQRLPFVVAPRFGGLVAHLPSQAAPALSETSVEAFATAFDEVVEALAVSIVMGMSVGALVALSMRSPAIRHVVAVEPPLETGKLWQLLATMRRQAEDHAAFYDRVMGFDGQDLHGRSYLHLLDQITRPTDFVVGGLLPFPARASSRMLSTVCEAQRLLIGRTPGAKLHVGPTAGHAVHREEGPLLMEVLLRACESVSQAIEADAVQ